MYVCVCKQKNTEYYARLLCWLIGPTLSQEVTKVAPKLSVDVIIAERFYVLRMME